MSWKTVKEENFENFIKTFLDFVSPVCLPFSEMLSSSSSSPPSDPEVAGWGAVDPLARRFSNITQWVVVPLADKEDCVDIYKVGPGQSIYVVFN